MGAVLVDAGPLIAILSRRDRHHEACRRALREIRGPLWTVWPVLTEACYLLATVSPRSPDALLEMVESGVLELAELDRRDAPRIRELMEKYADLPMDLADAALVRAAEREKVATIFTLDRRDFSLYRPSHTGRFQLLP